MTGRGSRTAFHIRWHPGALAIPEGSRQAGVRRWLSGVVQETRWSAVPEMTGWVTRTQKGGGWTTGTLWWRGADAAQWMWRWAQYGVELPPRIPGYLWLEPPWQLPERTVPGTALDTEGVWILTSLTPWTPPPGARLMDPAWWARVVGRAWHRETGWPITKQLAVASSWPEAATIQLWQDRPDPSGGRWVTVFSRVNGSTQPYAHQVVWDRIWRWSADHGWPSAKGQPPGVCQVWQSAQEEEL